MHPRYHVIIGLIFSLILLYFFPKIGTIGFFLIWFSSVLIDVDHYLYYVYQKKNWNLKKAYLWFRIGSKKLNKLSKKQRSQFYQGFSFLHGFEILLLILIVGFFISEIFYFIFIGFTLHLFLDLIYQRTLHNRFDKYSIIYDFIKYKKLRFIEELGDLSYDIQEKITEILKK